MDSPFFKILNTSVEKFPDKPAIIHGRKGISFFQFWRQIEQFGAYLENKGIGKGDRVLVYVPMSIVLYVILLALWHRGAIAIFLDAWTSKNRLNNVAGITQCKAFIGAPKAHLLRLLSPAVRTIPKKIWILPFGSRKSNYPISSPVSVKYSDTALVTFTTGSTGVPKGANRTYEFLLSQNQVLKEHLNLNIDDVDLTTLPIFVLNNLAIGMTSVLAPIDPAKPESANPKKLIETIERHKITCSAGSPIIFQKLCDYLLEKKIGIRSLKKIFLGGAPVFPNLAQKLNLAFPGSAVEIVYGSTEAEPISAVDCRELIREKNRTLESGLCVGRPVSQIKLVIIKMIDGDLPGLDEEAFGKIQVIDGEVGEICVTGEHVLKQYYFNKDAENRNKINVNNTIWHRTGDAGRLDKEGVLYLMGRVKARIELPDKTVFVFPWENALCEIEGVKMGTVIMVDGNIYMIAELIQQNFETKEQVRRTLAKFPIPHTKVIFSPIPRDPRHNSKIDYEVLKKHVRNL